MRTEFLQVSTRKQAAKLAPWAAVIVKCDGGYMAYESVDDARTAKNQR